MSFFNSLFDSFQTFLFSLGLFVHFIASAVTGHIPIQIAQNPPAPVAITATTTAPATIAATSTTAS